MEPQSVRPITMMRKVVKTIFLALCWVCLGLMMEVAGPTLIDLKTQTKSSYEEVATAIAGQNIGYIIGAILGGVLVDKLGHLCELMVALSLDTCAVATVGIPWVARTEVIWVLCCVQGIGGGVLNTSGMKLIFNMWLDKAASPMHVLHGGYGIGSFISPLIANPFLAVPAPKDHKSAMNNITLCTGENASLTEALATTPAESRNIRYLKESRIEFAYLIPALITICLSLVFLGFQFNGSKERRRQSEKNVKNVVATKSLKFKQMLNPATCADGDIIYGLEVFILLFLFYFNCVGGERIGGTFIRAYSIDHFGFGVDEGSYINISFWISFAVGRYVGFLAARWISIRILILIESGGLLITAICFASLGGSSSTALWVIIQPMGFFTGPFFPSGMGWGNYHVKMTGIAIATLQLGACIGAFAYLKLMGFLYDTYGTQTYLYSLLGYGIGMFVISVLLDAVGIFHSKKLRHIEDEKDKGTINETEEGNDKQF